MAMLDSQQKQYDRISSSTTEEADSGCFPFHTSKNANHHRFRGVNMGMENLTSASISVRDLSIKTRPSISPLFRLLPKTYRAKYEQPEKTILSKISLDIYPGILTAIVGGSGSGKTTLIETISKRLSQKGLDVSGSVSYLAKQIELGAGSSADIDVAYVVQEDALIPQLTVRETLTYAAELRLPSSWSKRQRQQAVEDVIKKLDLTACADTRIGDRTHKGCSGGEKRRTSIGVQLLANRSILILDEPTTGLDAASSFQVMRLLRKIAKEGKTVLVTIHQPRADIWHLIEDLIVLTKGSLLFANSVSSCLPYWESQGYIMAKFANPFEFIIDAAAIDTRSPELEQASTARVHALVRAWEVKTMAEFASEKKQPKHQKATLVTRFQNKPSQLWSAFRQISVLTRRTWWVTVRDPLGLMAGVIEALAMGIISGIIFLNIGSDLSGIRSREGAMWSAAVLQSYLIMIFETYRLTDEIKVFDRERREGVVSAFTYAASRRLARATLEDIPVPLLYTAIFYFMTGFRRDGPQYLRFFAIVYMLHLVAVNLGTFCVALSRNFTNSSLTANLLYTMQTFPGGFVLNTRNIGVWFRWLKWTSCTYYAFSALCTNEFRNQFYDCPYPGGPENPACKEYTGEYILESLSIPLDWLWKYMVIIAAYAVLTFLLSVLVLHIKRVDINVSRQYSSDTGLTDDMVENQDPKDGQRRPVTMKIEDCSLIFEKTSVSRKKTRKTIVSGVTTIFEPGSLNAIIGATGSGKTSLLNMLAHRLPERVGIKWHTGGTILLNDAPVTKSVLDSICSYVPQTDDDMLPYLTVRETIHFAARMRLPQWMNDNDKIRRAEELILRLGLKDCADALIGNEHMKGVSGGEKRRVTIAIQILTDPNILFLDEPTSGLDAFTASAIIDVLQSLADQGRTIILTIHQPRSELFKRFSNVLILASGGLDAYSGRVSDMLLYFDAISLRCPENQNPADFALDVAYSGQLTTTLVTRGDVKGTISKSTMTSKVERKDLITSPVELGSEVRRGLPFVTAFLLLLKRGLINIVRQPNLATARPSQIMGLGIVAMAFFTPLRYDYYAVQSRIGYLQQYCSIYFVGMINAIGMYPAERDLFYREDDDKLYPIEAFFLYYLMIEFPGEIVGAILFAIVAVLATGLPRTAALVFQMAYNAFCVVSCGESMGIIFMTVCSHTGLAVSLSCIVLSISLHLTGVLSLSIPDWLDAIGHISPLKWFVGNLAVYSIKDIEFTCNDNQRLANGRCPIETGEQVLELYKLNVNPTAYVAALAGVTVGYRLVAYIFLRIWRRGIQMPKLRKKKTLALASPPSSSPS